MDWIERCSDFVVSLLLGNRNIHNQLEATISSDPCQNCQLRRIKQYFGKLLNHFAAVHTINHSFEEFNEKIPIEVLDDIFRKLSFNDIKNVQFVSKQWRELVSSRRHFYSKKIIPHGTISHNKNVIKISTAASSVSIFGGQTKTINYSNFEKSLKNVKFDTLDINIFGNFSNISQLCLDIVEARHLKIYFKNCYHMDKEKLIEIFDKLNKNPYLIDVYFITFGGAGFPKSLENSASFYLKIDRGNIHFKVY